MIIFFASLVAILYYLGIMQRIVRWVGGAIGWVTGISRVESLARRRQHLRRPVANRRWSSAPISPALPPPQLFTVMTVGMAGVAGTILAAYASLLGAQYLPYLLAAAFMSAPGGILMAKIIMPDELAGPDELPLEGGEPDDDQVDVAETFEEGERPANIIMAAAQGAQTGVKLAVAVGAMVLAFVALVALANGLLGGIGGWFGDRGPELPAAGRLRLPPIMFLIGIPWNEAGDRRRPVRDQDGAERVRRLHRPRQRCRRGSAQRRAAARSSPSRLCGFANFSSIAIQMAVTGGLAPNQRPMIAKLGIKRADRRQPRQSDERGAGGMLIP